MEYNNVIQGIFIERPNRFIALVKINNKIEKVHVRNTGRCKELLIKGTKVFLERSDNIRRKTRYSIISAYKGDVLVNIDSQIPNRVVKEAIRMGNFESIYKPEVLKSEIKYNNSRFDLYYEKNDEKGFIEVKGVTLETNNIAMFPDAPTKRGVKHLYEMARAVKDGYRGFICFLIQMGRVDIFKPNKNMDLDFYDSLVYAKEAGVELRAYNCIVAENVIKLHNKVKVFI